MERLYLFVGDQSCLTHFTCSVLAHSSTSSSPPRYKHYQIPSYSFGDGILTCTIVHVHRLLVA